MNLKKVHRDPVFDSQPRPTLLLDIDFTIRAANSAYLSATARSAEELVDVHLFDAFPDNPEDPEADGVANLSQSLEQVARSRHQHNMWVQRYDIPDTSQGGWVKRYWRPINSPVTDDGRVVGVLHQVEDITPLEDGLRRVMEEYRDIFADDRSGQGHHHGGAPVQPGGGLPDPGPPVSGQQREGGRRRGRTGVQSPET